MPTIVIPDGKRKEDIFVIQNEQYLLNNIEARHYTSYLFVNNVFSEDEMEKVDETIEYQERNRLFLNILSEKGRKGYQVFERGLSKRGYINNDLIEQQMKVKKESTIGSKHIIVGRAWREFIDPKDETSILQNRAILIRKLQASRLTSYLVSKQIIDGHDMSSIDSLPRTLGNKELLRIVCLRGSSAFMWFVEGLRVKGYGRLAILLLGRPITSSTNVQDEESGTEEESSSSVSSSLSDDDSETTEDQSSKSQKSDTQTDLLHQDADTKSSEGNLRDVQSSKDNSPQTEVHQSEVAKSITSTQQDREDPLKDDAIKDDTDETQSKRNEPIDARDTESNKNDADAAQTGDDAENQKEKEQYIIAQADENNTKREDDIHINKEEKEQHTDKQNDCMKNKPEKASGSRSKTSTRGVPSSPFKKFPSRNIIREPIDYVQAEKLKNNMDLFERSLDAPSVICELKGSEVLDKVDAETMASLREPHQKVRELISLILWGGQEAFKLFLEALLKSNQTLIHNALTTEKRDSVRKNSTGIPCIVIDEVELVQSEDTDEDEKESRSFSKQSQGQKPYKFRWETS